MLLLTSFNWKKVSQQGFVEAEGLCLASGMSQGRHWVEWQVALLPPHLSGK